jgi:hypothetical protein
MRDQEWQENSPPCLRAVGRWTVCLTFYTMNHLRLFWQWVT